MSDIRRFPNTNEIIALIKPTPPILSNPLSRLSLNQTLPRRSINRPRRGSSVPFRTANGIPRRLKKQRPALATVAKRSVRLRPESAEAEAYGNMGRCLSQSSLPRKVSRLKGPRGDGRSRRRRRIHGTGRRIKIFPGKRCPGIIGPRSPRREEKWARPAISPRPSTAADVAVPRSSAEPFLLLGCVYIEALHAARCFGTDTFTLKQ